MKSILVVDDEEDVGYLVKKVLEKTGEYQVEFTSHPREALTTCQQHPPDLLLVDNVMPEMNGQDLIKELQRRDDTRQILIVVASGLGEMVYTKRDERWRWMPNRPVVLKRGDIIQEKNAERAAQAFGVDAYLAKPFTAASLLEVVKEVFVAAEGKKGTAPGQEDVL